MAKEWGYASHNGESLPAPRMCVGRCPVTAQPWEAAENVGWGRTRRTFIKYLPSAKRCGPLSLHPI